MVAVVGNRGREHILVCAAPAQPPRLGRALLLEVLARVLCRLSGKEEGCEEERAEDAQQKHAHEWPMQQHKVLVLLVPANDDAARGALA